MPFELDHIALLDLAGDAAFVRCVDSGEVRHWSVGAERAYGLTSAEAVGRRLADVVTSGPADRLAQAEAAIAATGRWRGELSRMSADGVVRRVASRWALQRDAAGRAVAVVEVDTAIEEAGDAQTAALVQQTRDLLEQQRLFEALLSHVPVAIAFLDTDLIYRRNNPAHSRRMGLSPKDIIGKAYGELTPESTDELQGIAREVLRTGVPYFRKAAPMKLSRDREGVSYWDHSLIPSIGDDGVVAGLIVISREVTGHVALEAAQRTEREAMKAAEAIKEQFLASVSHELRTPLMSVLGFGALLEESLEGPYQEYAGRIVKGGEVLLSLIEDLLTTTSIQAGAFTVERRVMAFDEVCREVLHGLTPIAARREIRLEHEVPHGLPVVWADAQRVGQALRNLVSNAIKFSPPGEAVTVRADVEDGRLRVEVVDRGAGIAPEDQAKLFQRFSQLEAGKAHGKHGAGLGLSITKALVEAHGGAVGLDSAPGQGSTFWFTLPLGRAT